MNQTRFDVKRNFLSRTFSRCLAEMCPGVVRLEYHLHDNGDEISIIRCSDGSTRRVMRYTGKRRRRWGFWLAVGVWALLAVWILTAWARG